MQFSLRQALIVTAVIAVQIAIAAPLLRNFPPEQLWNRVFLLAAFVGPALAVVVWRGTVQHRARLSAGPISLRVVRTGRWLAGLVITLIVMEPVVCFLSPANVDRGLIIIFGAHGVIVGLLATQTWIGWYDLSLHASGMVHRGIFRPWEQVRFRWCDCDLLLSFSPADEGKYFPLQVEIPESQESEVRAIVAARATEVPEDEEASVGDAESATEAENRTLMSQRCPATSKSNPSLNSACNSA